METEATAAAIPDLRDHAVSVDLINLIPTMTGHHRCPLVAWVLAIAPIPEKTGKGPSSAPELTRLYGLRRNRRTLSE